MSIEGLAFFTPGLKSALETAPDEEGFRRFVSAGLRFERLDDPEGAAKQRHRRLVRPAMEQLDHQRSLGFEVFAGEIHRQFDQELDARGVGVGNTRQVGRHVRHDQIELGDSPGGQRRLQAGQHLGFAEVALPFTEGNKEVSPDGDQQSKSELIFLAQKEGSIVSLIADPAALVNNPRPDRENDELWTLRTPKIPPVGTPVQVTIRLEKK